MVKSSQIAQKNSTTTADYQYFYGIDVSMETLVTAKLSHEENKGNRDRYDMMNYTNEVVGIGELIESICKNGEPHLTLVTLEATGTYSMKVVSELIAAEIPVAMLNPKQAAGFINGVMLRTTKTDERDAQGLAKYGQVNRPKPYQLPDERVVELKQLRNMLFQLKKIRSMYINQLHALEYHYLPNEFVVEKYEQLLADADKDIAEIEGKLCTMSQETFDKMHKLAMSIKGIGKATAPLLLMVTNGCQDFKNVKQLAKFLGICPTQKESGKSVRRRGGISKTGTRQVRALLYMCARSAKRYNLACKELYERLTAKGKCHKVAMTAVAHKLVKQFFAVIKSGVPFDNEYHLKRLKRNQKETANTKPILN